MKNWLLGSVRANFHTTMTFDRWVSLLDFVVNLERFVTEPTQQEVIAKEILIHPAFNRRNLQNDICLIKTEKMILGES